MEDEENTKRTYSWSKASIYELESYLAKIDSSHHRYNSFHHLEDINQMLRPKSSTRTLSVDVNS